jgi:glycosyltransferase involved in cell wall biosynthesis
MDLDKETLDLISIIIPVFNRHDYARRAIQSVVNQFYENWEIFIIDDNSDTPYLLPDFCKKASQKISLIRNETNLGPGLSRQRGLDLACGVYVCFLDSDDYWKPDFLIESFKAHSDKPGICATYCQSEMSDGSLRRRNSIEDAVDDIFYGVVSGVRPWATCALMWKKMYLAKWNTIRTNQDALFELNSSLLNYRISFIPKVLAIINKDTGMNSEDLVSKRNVESNRNIVLRFAVKLLDEYEGKSIVKIKSALWISLKRSLRKQIKYRNYKNSAITLLLLIRNVHWAFIRIKSN